LVSREVSASPALQAQVRARGGYARRYDPIRSTVEHDALRRRKVNLAGEAANLKVAHPDLCAEFETVELQRAYERRVADDLARAGIEDARLIRNLDMVEFSFGFSRVSATPETTQKDRRMPVRLMGFPPLPSNAQIVSDPSMLRAIIGNLVGNYSELVELMELANRGKVNLATNYYKLQEANQALHDLHHGKIKGRAVLVP